MPPGCWWWLGGLTTPPGGTTVIVTVPRTVSGTTTLIVAPALDERADEVLVDGGVWPVGRQMPWTTNLVPRVTCGAV
ncbi:MAG: hypothetical protein JWR52_3685 [Marmoricola sp.]|nr:hypothetical protein [Marmoricola sp.]